MILTDDNNYVKTDSNGFIYDTPYIAPPGTNYIPTVNTIGYWPLNNDGLDYSGNAKDLTFYGPQSFVDNTKFGGKASFFDGVSDTTTCYGYSPSITFDQNNSTFSCWIYTTSGYGNFMNSMSAVGAIGTWFGMNGGGSLGGHLGSCGDWNWGVGLTVPSNTWTHVVLTRNTTGVDYYLNGSAGTSYVGSCSIVIDYPMYIGGVHEVYGAGYRAFNGYICEVIVENTYWDSTKVSNYYTPRA